jgi:hypothetical protein
MSKSQDHKAFEAAINQFPPEKREKMRELVLKKLALQAQQKALLEGGLTYKDINEVDQHKNGIGFAMEQEAHTPVRIEILNMIKRRVKQPDSVQGKEMLVEAMRRWEPRIKEMEKMTYQQQKDYLIAQMEARDKISR